MRNNLVCTPLSKYHEGGRFHHIDYHSETDEEKQILAEFHSSWNEKGTTIVETYGISQPRVAVIATYMRWVDNKNHSEADLTFILFYNHYKIYQSMAALKSVML